MLDVKTTNSSQLQKCSACPRLVSHRQHVEAQYPDYYNRPVPLWGDRRARILVVGLAPGLHGAARTGRAFVGDASGSLLFAALAANGLSTDANPDNALLRGVAITNVVKCLPPQNAPLGSEVNTCRPYLELELGALMHARARKPRCVIALGGVAYRALGKAITTLPIVEEQTTPRLAPFAHGQETKISTKLTVLASFHPSRLNVNTGRINLTMLNQVLERAKAITA